VLDLRRHLQDDPGGIGVVGLQLEPGAGHHGSALAGDEEPRRPVRVLEVRELLDRLVRALRGAEGDGIRAVTRLDRGDEVGPARGAGSLRGGQFLDDEAHARSFRQAPS
jgi:hypothetical protein